jgi:hypothetical protein
LTIAGINGYTELPEFGEFTMLKRPRDDIVKLFSSQPLDFAPGGKSDLQRLGVSTSLS